MFHSSSWEILFLGDVLEIWVLSKQKLGGEQDVECASKTRMREEKKGGRGIQQKKPSACGEDLGDSSGVLCEVLLEPVLFTSLICCGG